MTQMLDHIIKADSEAGARSLLPSYCSQDEQGQWHWKGEVLGPHENFRGIIARAVWDNSDPMNPILVSPEIVLPGCWIGIATNDIAESMSLRALPNNACRVVLNREASRPGAANWVFEYISPDVDLVLLSTIKYEPIFLGSPYY